MLYPGLRPKLKMNNLNFQTMQYRKKIIGEVCNIPFDAAWSFLYSSKRILRNKMSLKTGDNVSALFCPHCMAPWIAGYNTASLFSQPRSVRFIKHLEKKEKCKRLPKKQKLLLDAYRNNSNFLKVVCKLCNFTMIQECKLQNELQAPIPENIVSKTSKDLEVKKKKRKKVKDFNAGIVLNSMSALNSFNVGAKCCTEITNKVGPESGSLCLLHSESETSLTSEKNNKIYPLNLRNCKRKRLILSKGCSSGEEGKLQTKSQVKQKERKRLKLKEIISGTSNTYPKPKPQHLDTFLSTLI